MTANWIILPVVLPMLTGIVSLLASSRRRTRSAVGTIGLATNLCAAVAIAAGVFVADRPLVLQVGDWPAPFGITLVVDAFAAIMLVAAAFVLLATFVYCNEQLQNQASGFFHPLFHLLGLGVQWSLVTADLFNLFVAFELMLMASYALLALGTTRAQMRQAYKYVLINLLASMLFVTCCGLVYGHVGTLNFADLARLSHSGNLPAGLLPTIIVLLLVFGIKTAVFPLWFWLPDAYPTLPAGLGGVFGGLLTKVGAYVLIRVFVMVLGPAEGSVAELVGPLSAVAAGVTMLLGVVGAVSMNTVRQILSVHIMSQVGYMVLAVALALSISLTTENREAAVAAGIFFIVHNMVVKSSLFLCGGLMERHTGSDQLDRMGGLARRAPWLGAMFLVAALSLAGLPPLSGFFAKYVLIREAFGGGRHVLAAAALITSVLTLLSMAKIWAYAFWSYPYGERRPSSSAAAPSMPVATAATAALVVAALGLGLGAERVFGLARTAARGVVDPASYVEAVLGADRIHPLRVVAAPREEQVSP